MMHTRTLWKRLFLAAALVLMLACSSAAPAGYIDNLDGTVTDNDTGLMWQKTPPVGAFAYTWQAALAYCENSSLAAYTDWRLPTAKELESLTDKSRYYPPIDPYFPACTGACYFWSSTTDAGNSVNTWVS
jgi:hypothetical protein